MENKKNNPKLLKELELKKTKKLKSEYFDFYDDIKNPTHKRVDW
jgi:hypothetical protein